MKRTIPILFAGALVLAVCWSLLFGPHGEESDPAAQPTEGAHPDRSVVDLVDGMSERHLRVTVEPGIAPVPEPDAETPPEFQPLDGPGWHVWGRVLDEDGSPVENVEVDLWFILEADGTIDDHTPMDATIDANPVATVCTDAMGRYGANVLVPDFFQRYARTRTVPGDVLIRVRAAGYLSETIAYDGTYEPTLPYPSCGGTVLRIDFDGLVEGVNLWGRVVAAGGEPVFHAEVDAFDPTEDDFYVETTPDGVFAVPILSANGYHLDVYKEDVGANAFVTGEIPSDRDVTIPDIALRGDGMIEGSVVYANGLPAADVVVWAWLDPDYEMDLEPGEGLIETIARTGQDGRFRLSPLISSVVERRLLSISEGRDAAEKALPPFYAQTSPFPPERGSFLSGMSWDY